ncbi:amino acid adenylation domain-containing protein [Brevibacillus laterosporus]|nr:non-ribosomal peptide synthetase [Brevibacillus laterosporus]TPG89131.1 amino acid adenylation domain-containing protein [Brevibacillus laterosporus]
MYSKSDIKDIYFLSPMQESMLFHYLMGEQTTTYFEQFHFQLSGAIDNIVFDKTVQTLVARYDILRTIFIHQNVKKPVQAVVKRRHQQIDFMDISHLTEADQRSFIEQYKKDDRSQGFDLTKDVPLRISVICLGAECYEILWSFHHILLDGWSVGLLLGDFKKVYRRLAYKDNRREKVIEPFGKYVKWLGKLDKEDTIKYWSHYLADCEKKSGLPTLRDTDTPLFKLETKHFTLNKEITERLRQVSKNYNVSLNIVFNAIWGIILQKYNDTNDVVFGSVVSGRPPSLERMEEIVGMFINTIPIRVKREVSTTFSQLLEQLRDNATQSIGKDYVPLSELQSHTALKKALIDHVVVFENYPIDNLLHRRDPVTRLSLTNILVYEETNYHLNVVVVPNEEMEIRLGYNTYVYDTPYIEAVAQQLERLAERLSHEPELLISELGVMTVEEMEEYDAIYNQTQMEKAPYRSISQWFEAQVKQHAQKTALVSRGEKVSYDELNKKANQLARKLISSGAGSGKLVAIIVEHIPEMIISMFAVAKSGAAYVPIDPEYGEARIANILEESRASVVLTQEKFMDGNTSNREILYVDHASLYTGNDENLIPMHHERDNLYVIYTSGTTGKSKGVQVSHANVMNYLSWFYETTGVSTQDRVALCSSYAFDLGYTALFSAITAGAELHLVEKDTYTLPARFLEYIHEHRLTYLKMTPTLYSTLVNHPYFTGQQFEHLKFVVLGGEPINSKDVEKTYQKTAVRIMNHYGPTETTIGCIAQWVDRDDFEMFRDRPTIGKPIGNTRIYILDKDGNQLPPGVFGEISVAGDGVSNGYIAQMESNQEKFVIQSIGSRLERLYRTGDVGRWLASGCIEYQGRIDNQVKIRGYRVELGEIENALLKHEAITDAVVTATSDEQGISYLNGYVVSTLPLKKDTLRSYLMQQLPDYMVPTSFIQLEKIPVNENGKVDRLALPKPVFGLHGYQSYVAPRTKLEEKMVQIWQEVLGIKVVGIYDDFFQLGGHSLKAITLVSRILMEFKTEITLRQLFASPTVSGLALLIEGSNKKEMFYLQPTTHKEYYVASSAQKRIYALAELDLETTIYNMPSILDVEGKLDRGKLERAFQQLIERHEALRTSFDVIEGKLVQRIADCVAFNLIERTMEEGATIQDVINCFIKPFDLRTAPLIRAQLIHVGNKTLLMFDLHHIISDGVSSGIIVNDLIHLYENQTLSPVEFQYKDFSEWQQSLLQSDEMMKQEEYWLKQFEGEIPVLNLLTDFIRPAIQSFNGHSVDFEIHAELVEKLRELSRETGTTMYMVLLSAYLMLLSKYTSQEDIVVGTVYAGRSHIEFANTLGMFVQTLPIRQCPTGLKTIKQFLLEVKETFLDSLENQEYPLENMLERLHITRDASRNPLFDTVFVMENMDIPTFTLSGAKLSPQVFDYKVAKFDMTLLAEENGEKIRFKWEYCTDLYLRGSIERMIIHYQQILQQMVAERNQLIETVTLITQEEQNVILNKFNQPSTWYPKQKTLSQLFEEQVEKTPDKIALIHGEERVTYRELNERANQFAHGLQEKGVSPGTVVGLLTTPSTKIIVAILAVLKAGGTYLPMDSSYSWERIQMIMDDSGATILLVLDKVDWQGDEYLHDLVQEVLVLDELSSSVCELNHSNVATQIDSSSIAYIMYTSGSTGKSKGNMTSHYSITRVVKNTNYIEIKETDVLLNLSNFAFDGSTFDMYGALLNGASLVLIDKETMTDVQLLGETIAKENVTLFFLTTALFNTIVEIDVKCLSNVRHILFGGERASVRHIRKAIDVLKDSQLIHVYGPTESTVFATYHYLNELLNNVVPIGKPISNTQIFIMDPYLKLQPVGAIGEICIAGDGLARGYLNRPEMTSEKFVDHPFETGQKLYKTGDLGRWLTDGSIEFLGRIDNQVKIRGFRVELGEVEAHLLALNGIKEVTVITREDEIGTTFLCAYFVSEFDLQPEEIKEQLAKTLPYYMIPTFFIQMDSLPLNANGKVNQAILPYPDWGKLHVEMYVKPKNEIEQEVAEIWQDTLGVQDIGVRDNFFALGGQSLKAIVMLAKIKEKFGVRISLKQLFANPTIENVAIEIQEVSPTEQKSIPRVTEQAHYPTSSAQKRMYYAAQFAEESTYYNIPYAFNITGVLSLEKWSSAYSQLFARHEALRTTFTLLDGEVIQFIHSDMVPSYDFQIIEKSKLDQKIQDFVKPFDLEAGPLFRMKLIRLADKEYVVLMDIHHIVADGISLNILHKELMELYNGNVLELPKLQYKDFAVWEQSAEAIHEREKMEAYWIKQFESPTTSLKLPMDYTRPAIQRFEGDYLPGMIDRLLTDQLKSLAQEAEVTLYSLLLSAFSIVLGKYAGQEDVTVGTVTAGRQHPDLETTVGMFVNTLALRNYPEYKKTCREYVKEVGSRALEAFDNQQYPLENLVSALRLERDSSRNTLFDVMFVLENMELAELTLPNLTCTPIEIYSKTTKTDISLVAQESEEGIWVKWEYSTHLFKEKTIERMHSHFVHIISQLVTDFDQSIGELEIVTDVEKDQLLFECNQTRVPYPTEMTLLHLFEKQVEQTPHEVALVLCNEQLTYKELLDQTSCLAKVLLNRGIQSEDVVGIKMSRSFEMIISILAVWKVGATYVPIDPDYPMDRVLYMLDDSKAKWLMIQSESQHVGTWDQKNIIEVDCTKLCIDDKISNFDNSVPHHLAYVIYTSGTTGKPKGVAVEHASIANTIQWRRDEYRLMREDVVLQLFSYSFDGFLTSLFTPLVSGSKVILVTDEHAKDSFTIANSIFVNKVTHFVSVPSLFDAILNSSDYTTLSSLQKVTLAGEAITQQLVRKSKDLLPELELVNEYGPTENSVASTVLRNVDVESSDSIGKPISNTVVTILGKDNKLVPIGVEGELCLSGVGLARGYLHRPDLTQQKFIEHPYHRETRLYKTGDAARWLPNGTIQFLGRIDHQVKVRGHRIELGEIEHALHNIDYVNQTVVIGIPNARNQTQLCAYIVASKELHAREIRQQLSSTLPNYMIPAYVIQIEEIPLTPNGKVDSKQLSEANVSSLEKETQIPASTVTEAKLVDIWCKVLEAPSFGIDDSFFEHGGDSLKAMELVVEIKQQCNVKIALAEIFNFPSIRQLSQFIDQGNQVQISHKIKPVPPNVYYPASSAQKRIYLLQQMQKGTVYNVPTALRITGLFDYEKANNAFVQLIARHEALRTTFSLMEGKLVQIIHKEVPFDLHLVNDAKEDIEQLIHTYIKPFDLSQGPLLHVTLCTLGTAEHLLLVDLHHVIVDGISAKLLIQEWLDIYNGNILPDIHLQYKDFAVWQEEIIRTGSLAQQEQYWLNIFEKDRPVMKLPLDYQRTAQTSTQGDFYRFNLDEEQTEILKEIAKQTGTTPFMLLLACYNVLLHKLTGQEDIIVGCAVSGRNYSELRDMIGMLVNTLALRNYPRRRDTFQSFLQQVRQHTLEAFEHQDYPFENIIDHLKIPRAFGRNPLFDTLFEWQTGINDDQKVWAHASNLVVTQLELDLKQAKFELSMVATEVQKQVHFSLNYQVDLFKATTIQMIAEDYLSIVKAIMENPTYVIESIQLQSEKQNSVKRNKVDNQFIFEW